MATKGNITIEATIAETQRWLERGCTLKQAIRAVDLMVIQLCGRPLPDEVKELLRGKLG